VKTGRKRQEPLWIEVRDVVAIHGRVLAIHGGANGLRDAGLLESVLARPRQHYVYSKSAEIVQMAGLYTAGIVRNHPFFDGNKRVGFVAGILLLELNGFEFSASEEDAAQQVMALAAGTLDESQFEAWLRKNSRRQRGSARG
jgi:death on curing protein